ncbi:sigma-70 family RNA polymerase sigma factor [Paractinoplanes toevensis]|uniref:Homing endonuclease LAGLIDADG domain-containing protein n=1 Tax=Paractinoplanes toevensis TaxID=571911 RepID=A0A919W3P6_9ACTN|nr:sigma-70 family RNA polymerase sigma factor [Actinoplanes toevensis]GIM89298.1 hypothetical protein Ato02nite_010910 [Actinoplanes toevensis]
MDTKSYLMGVFDGEGSVNTYYQRGRWTLQVSVTMAAIEILELFRETWGGNLHIRKRKTAGGLTLGQWYIGSSKAIPFLEYAATNGMWRRRRVECALELARNMAKYTIPGVRKGINISQGGSFLTPEDHTLRERLVLEMRSLAGARSRFDPNFQADSTATATRLPAAARPTREQLVTMYATQQMSMREVADALGCSVGVVRSGLHEHGIPLRGHAEAARIFRARRAGPGTTT